MGMDYASLKAIKSDIILTSSTAFGSEGPYATRVGFDGVAQAMSGNMHLTGYADEPMKNYFPYVDFMTGTLNAMSTVVAIMHRHQTGEGQHVEGALLASALTVANGSLIEQHFLKKDRVGTGNRGQTAAPSDAFQTQDGWFLVQIVGNPLYERWAKLMGEAYLGLMILNSKAMSHEGRTQLKLASACRNGLANAPMRKSLPHLKMLEFHVVKC